MTLFGDVITGGHVEQAVLTTLQNYFPTYLRELERQNGYAQSALPNPRSFEVVPGRVPDRWPEDQLPSVILMSPGTVGTPHRTGEGFVSARWEVVVGVVCSANTENNSRAMAHIYAAAAYALLPQQLPQPNTVVSGCEFMHVGYDVIATEDTRSIDGASIEFIVEVQDVINDRGGPLVPDPIPAPVSPEWPNVTSTNVTVDKTPN